MIDYIPHELFTEHILGFLGPQARCNSIRTNRYLRKYSGQYIWTKRYFSALRIQRLVRRRTREKASREWRVSCQLMGHHITVITCNFPEGITGLFWKSDIARAFTLIVPEFPLIIPEAWGAGRPCAVDIPWKDVYEIDFTPWTAQEENINIITFDGEL